MSKTTLIQFFKNLKFWTPYSPPKQYIIGPFIISEAKNSISALLDDKNYKQHIFEEESAKFASGIRKFHGSCYEWKILAKEFLEEQLPHLQKDIQLEYLYNRKDRCRFCARSENKESILEFVQSFHNMCEDEKLMREILVRMANHEMFPEINQMQVVLLRADNATGKVLDSNFKLRSAYNKNQEKYTIFESLDEAVSYIMLNCHDNPDVEFMVHDHLQKLIYSYFPNRL